MYNNVIEVNSSVLYTWNLLRLYVLSILSKKKERKWQLLDVMDMLNSFDYFIMYMYFKSLSCVF